MCCRAVPIWNNVAREHEPAITASLPSRRGSSAGSSRSDSSPAARKFSGKPIAIPEPPVMSACAAAARPIATRCASVTASMIA